VMYVMTGGVPVILAVVELAKSEKESMRSYRSPI
jgi:hypothetical protein